MASFAQDLRYALRTLGRTPGFTAVAVLVIALGIGANTAIFTFTNAYLLRPLPFPDSGRLAMITGIRVPQNRLTRATTDADFAAFRRHARSFEAIGAGRLAGFSLSHDGRTEQISGMEVTSGLLRTLAVTPHIGRSLAASDDQPGAPPVVILSYGLWQERFGARADVLGRTVRLNGVQYAVAGVMPGNFRYPGRECRLWTSLQLPAAARGREIHIVGRLRRGVPLPAAAAEMASILSGSGIETDRGAQVALATLYDGLNYRSEAGPASLVLLVAVGFVLLIACANVANLLLARGAARSHEIAVRMALGAGRLRIAGQALTESLVISVAGGVLGLWLGTAGLKLLLATAPARMFPLGGIEPDWNVLLFTAAAALVSGVLFGLAPAVQASAVRLGDRLKQGGRAAAGAPSRGRLRRVLVIAELAPAVVLLIGAGLLLKSFAKLQSVELGFRPQNVLVTELTLSETRYAGPEQRAHFIAQALEAAARVPGVTAAGMISRFGRNTGGVVAVAGQPAPEAGRGVWAVCRSTSADYFRAMGIPLRAGRYLNVRDTAGAQRVVVINETMARRFWPGESPVGRAVRLTTGEPQGWMTIVGVVGDERQNLFGAIPPEMYVHYPQAPPDTAMLVVHAPSHAAEAAGALRAEIRRVDPDQQLASIGAMEQRVADSAAPERLIAQFLGMSAAIALLMAISGLYGVIACSVLQRRHELGVRMALGAARGDVLRLVLKQGAVLATIGIGLGLGIAFAVSRVMAGLLFGVNATDPYIFTAVPAILGLSAMIASYVPARRAASLDPVVALRME